MPSPRYRLAMQIRFCDIDGLGHINNAVYHSFIEMARTRWLDELLDGAVFTRGERIPIILARTEIDFIQQAHLHDELYVECYISHIGDKSFHQLYEVRRGEELVAKAKAVLVWYDFDAKQSVSIPQVMRARMQE